MMTQENQTKIVEKLNEILEWELSGVARYLHYSLMITGPNRIPIVKWFRDQALEAFDHAAVIGEKITSLGGHPSIKVTQPPERNEHAVMTILHESLEYELTGLKMYEGILPLAEGNVALEELIREQIRTEQEHVEEVRKMIVPAH
jgi:bacterioferritin